MEKSEVERWTHALTENANLELNVGTMAKIKEFCKTSPQNTSHVFHLFMIQLRKQHSEIRFIILLAINELFQRSFQFRRMMESNLEEFFELTLETNNEKLLPPPKNVANRLKLKTQVIAKDWNAKFGDKCKKIRLAYEFLKSCDNIPSENGNQLGSSHSILQQNISTNRLIEKIIQAKQQLQLMEPEIIDSVCQLENCFEVVIPLTTDLFPSSCFEADASESAGVEQDSEAKECPAKDTSMLRTHGIYNIQNSLDISVKDITSLTVEETTDNSDTLQMMREIHSKINKVYLPTITKWLKLFSKGEHSESLVKQTLDLKQILQAKVDKYNKLNFESNTNSYECKKSESSESDSDFEEVKEKEGYEAMAVSDDHAIDKVLVRTCHALLPSGKLCPRQDKFKCPFHGTIIDRDEHGFPVNAIDKLNLPSTSSQSSLPDWQDPEFLKDIKSNIGIDLTLPEKKKTKTGKIITKRRKKSVRTDVKNINNTTYNRLYKKVFKKSKVAKK